jgi:hypothetical protein
MGSPHLRAISCRDCVKAALLGVRSPQSNYGQFIVAGLPSLGAARPVAVEKFR